MVALNGGGGAGLPFYAFLDGSGKRIANSMAMPRGGNIGFPANQQEITAFMALIAKTAPALSTAEHDRVLAHLNKISPSKK